ncbi:dTDP-4-dehydrorhamnose 3,5-epimerase [Pseudomonas fluorescens]|nr:dTDP-4-dehydrorhamnose 3,5-epimerase [Pseudomonas fluorescens]
MKVTQTKIPDVVVFEPQAYEDSRGWFMESFNEFSFHAELKKIGLPVPRSFVQDNHSCSKKGVLRGLHYQMGPHAQGKLVRVTKGAAYDVAVDIRRNSPTFGMSVGIELSAENRKCLWIPEGFAHGFVALEDDTHFLYKTTDVYCKELERSIVWNDSDLDIQWPRCDDFSVSEKDASAVSLRDAELPTFYLPGTTRLVDLKIIGDERGSLISLEAGNILPFDVKRVYYIFGTLAEVSRGFHAHKNLLQLAVCVSGKCRMVLDNGTHTEDVWLDSPSKGVFINNLIWREMHDFSEDCVLVVFASEKYAESDYIRNYDDFIRIVKAQAES